MQEYIGDIISHDNKVSIGLHVKVFKFWSCYSLEASQVVLQQYKYYHVACDAWWKVPTFAVTVQSVQYIGVI